MAALLPGVDGYIAGLDVIDRAALESADRLKVIARYGVGVDQVDLEAAKEKGIIVTNTPGRQLGLGGRAGSGVDAGAGQADPGSGAERPTGQMAALCRASRWKEKRSASWAWAPSASSWPAGWRVSTAASWLTIPLPMKALPQSTGSSLAPMETVIAEADFVSLHLPLLPETRGLVNDAFLAKMKKGAYPDQHRARRGDR